MDAGLFEGGLKIKKMACVSARQFFSHALFNYRISFISSPGLLIFSSYWDGEATIGGGILNEEAFILRYCRVAPIFEAHSFACFTL